MRRRFRSEDGQAAIEVLGIVPLLAVLALGVLQALLIGHTALATEQAARVAARTAMVTESTAAGRAAGFDALPARLVADAEVRAIGTNSFTVETVIPDVLPGISFSGVRLQRTVEMPEVATWD